MIVAVRDETGATGLGEAAPLPGMSIHPIEDRFEDALRACVELAARVPLSVATPGHASALADRVTTSPAARFAIETALLSTFAQRARTSIAHLLCARPQDELENAIVVDDEEQARVAAACGARCLKIKIGERSDDLARVRRIAHAAPSCHLRLDANRRWARADVRARLSMLAGLDIEYIEEPCVDAHELVDDALPFRIALDESLVEIDRASLARALTSPQLAALILKPTLLGGFARCLELATLAHRHDVAPIVSHALEGPIATAACGELARAIGANVPVGLAPHGALAHLARGAVRAGEAA